MVKVYIIQGLIIGLKCIDDLETYANAAIAIIVLKYL